MKKSYFSVILGLVAILTFLLPTETQAITIKIVSDADADWVYDDSIKLPSPPCQLMIDVEPSTCDLATNTYSLSVSLYYLNAPTGDIVVSGQNFTKTFTTNPSGNGLKSIIVTGLPANGLANLPVNAYCVNNVTCSVSTTYNAPPDCAPPCMLTIESMVPSTCDLATNTYSLDVKVNYWNAPMSAIEIFVNGQHFPPSNTVSGMGSVAFNLTGLPANGYTNIPVQPYFATNANCSALANYNAPLNCSTCLGNDGIARSVGDTETIPCPGSSCRGSQTRTCILNDSKAEWGKPIGDCQKMAGPGEVCSNRDGTIDKCCPVGFHCDRRPTTRRPCKRPWWCFLALGIPDACHCEKPLISTEFICIPD